MMRDFIILAFIGASCAMSRQTTRIIGGKPTNIETYPFMSNMLLDTRLGFIQFCGGTLVTDTAVVSAAHCYVNNPPPSWRVRLGSKFANSGGILHTVSKIILHEQNNATMSTNDVAVIKLTMPAVFSDKIKIARIAGPRYMLPDDTLVYTAGWGETECEGCYSEVLLHAAVKIINQQICTERYAYLKTLPDMSVMPDVNPEMLCTGILDVGGKDACQGDSGGPVIHAGDVLVGITSWGYVCGHPTYPGVNVRVSSYTDWIFTHSIN